MMKKIILSIAALALLSPIPSQARKVYAELLGQQKGLFSKKVKVSVDFGQNVSFWKQGDMILVDEEGKEIIFNSMVDAMNFMGQNGWEFVQAYVVTEGNQNVYHWLMTKEVNSDDDIKAGFNVKADLSATKLPLYSLTYMKKRKNSTQWKTVKTEDRRLTQEEIDAISQEWKAQADDEFDYEFQIKRIN